MSALSRSQETDPFHVPLEPLPSALSEEGGRPPQQPEAVRVPIPELKPLQEPERYLAAEEEVEAPEPVARREVTRVELSLPERAPVGRWKFWKRPSKRDQQLETLRQGATEMVGLMRSIRDHLESERGDREGLQRTLSPLPVAVESLRAMSVHQADTGRALGELRSTMERRAEHEGVLVESLKRIGDTMSNVDETFGRMDRTLAGIDRSNQRTVATIQTLGERVVDSDRFLNETFARLREAEREFTDYVTRSSRRNAFGLMALCSILLFSIVAVGFMFKENRELLTAVQKNGALVVQVPPPVRAGDERLSLFEDLEQVDDGIGKPEREIAKEAERERKPVDEHVVPVKEEGKPILSVNKLPPRE